MNGETEEIEIVLERLEWNIKGLEKKAESKIEPEDLDSLLTRLELMYEEINALRQEYSDTSIDENILRPFLKRLRHAATTIYDNSSREEYSTERYMKLLGLKIPEMDEQKTKLAIGKLGWLVYGMEQNIHADITDESLAEWIENLISAKQIVDQLHKGFSFYSDELQKTIEELEIRLQKLALYIGVNYPEQYNQHDLSTISGGQISDLKDFEPFYKRDYVHPPPIDTQQASSIIGDTLTTTHADLALFEAIPVSLYLPIALAYKRLTDKLPPSELTKDEIEEIILNNLRIHWNWCKNQLLAGTKSESELREDIEKYMILPIHLTGKYIQEMSDFVGLLAKADPEYVQSIRDMMSRAKLIV